MSKTIKKLNFNTLRVLSITKKASICEIPPSRKRSIIILAGGVTILVLLILQELPI